MSVQNEAPSELDPDTVEQDLVAEEVVRAHIPLKDTRPEDIALGINSFDDLPLNPRIREGVAKVGWANPTPVQKMCLPYTLRGRDVAGFAQTGTGKTAVFLITIMNKLLAAQAADSENAAAVTGVGRSPRAVVLAPTRELAMQIEQDAQPLFEHVGLASIAVFGGIDYDKQARRLKEGVDVIFATPGRLMDYIKKGMVDLGQVQAFVCDEADRMFDMGFIEDVEFFLERIPQSAQRLLFSATTNEQVKELAFEYLETPEYVSVNPETLTPEKIELHAIHCHATDKLKVILGLLRDHQPECAIVFTNTKLTAEWLHFKLVNNGIEADLITGDLPQSKRIRLIQRIKEGKLKALIATDVASRGLHISRVTHVYNFDLPDDAANYVHRVGRTARAGARGCAYSLVCDDYGQNLAAINDLLGPQVAMTTTWPDDRYMTCEDKSGNPFADRYQRRDRGGDRPERAGAESGPPRGPRDGRGRPQAQDGAGEPPHRGRGRQQGQEDGDSRRHRGPRDRGEPAAGRDGSGRGPGGGQGRGGRDQGRQRDHSGPQRPPRSRQGEGVSLQPAPKPAGGLISRILRALFGWGRKGT